MLKFKQAYYSILLLLFILFFTPHSLNIYFLLISIVIIFIHVNAEEDDDLEVLEDDDELEFNEMVFPYDLDTSDSFLLLFKTENSYIESLSVYIPKIPSTSAMYITNNLYLSDYTKHLYNYLQFIEYEDHENSYVLDAFLRNNTYSLDVTNKFFIESHIKMDNYPNYFFNIDSRSHIDFKNNYHEYFSFDLFYRMKDEDLGYSTRIDSLLEEDIFYLKLFFYYPLNDDYEEKYSLFNEGPFIDKSSFYTIQD